ncbi:hypothetical protein HDU76_008458 [Blyttiomyces sp. JEL0837]|nr:hypothetical protein HDU76_008458 [Blyttiomyces sp. JEL0837]
MESEDLLKAFEDYGKVKDVYIPRNYYTGDIRGFAYIQYSDQEDAERAFRKIDHVKVNGEKLTVEWASGNRKTPNQMKFRGDVRSRSRSPRRTRDRRRSRSRSRSPRRRDSDRRRRSRSRSRSRDREDRRRGDRDDSVDNTLDKGDDKFSKADDLPKQEESGESRKFNHDDDDEEL